MPVMLVYSQNGKVKWQMRSPDFPFHRLRYGVGKVPENTVMGDTVKSRISLSSWNIA